MALAVHQPKCLDGLRFSVALRDVCYVCLQSWHANGNGAAEGNDLEEAEEK
jgi:hypothetical protein